MGISLFVSECVCTQHGGPPDDVFAYKQPVHIHREEEGRERDGGNKKETENKMRVNVCVFLLKEHWDGKGVCLTSSHAEGLSI